METKETVPQTEEKKTDELPKEEPKVDNSAENVSSEPAPAEKTDEPKEEEKKEDGDTLAKLADALDAISKKLDAVLSAKDEKPSEKEKEEPKTDGCGVGDNEPKEEPKVTDSLPKYTQSLGAIEKGYSLDEAFARFKGGN